MKIRTALVVGFAVLFGVWLTSSYVLMRRLAEVDHRASEAHARFARSEALLSTIQSQVLLGSLYLRDALLDPGPSAPTLYREQLRAIRDEVMRAIADRPRVVDSAEEEAQWTRLEAEIDEFAHTIFPGADWTSPPSSVDVRAFLKERVIPRREIIVTLSGHIRALNQDALARERETDVVRSRDIQRTVWWTAVVVALLGLAIAAGATRYVGRLESQIQRQHADILDTTHDLEELSAKLVRAQEDERRMIARELHDEVGQALTAIKMELAVAERHSPAGVEPERSLQEARAITDGLLRTIRDLSLLLHPAMLDDLGLPATLKWYLRGYSERTGIRTELVEDHMDERLPPEVEICAYRIIQEGLTNVARHAQAGLCRVFLQRLPHSLLVTVEDDGKGLSMAPVRTQTDGRGIGLVGIRERAAGLGGTVRIDGGPGKGTRLTVELPMVVPAVERHG